MLMLDEYCIPLPDFGLTKVLNLFEQGTGQGYESSLVRVRALQHVGRHRALRLGTTDPIVPLHGAYPVRIVREAINDLLGFGLLEIKGERGMTRLPEESGSRDVQLCITGIGTYYRDELLWDRTYVALCAQCSLLPGECFRRIDGTPVYERVRELILHDEGLSKFVNELVNTYGDEPFVSLAEFVSFIECEETAERGKFVADHDCDALALSPRWKAILDARP